jgi:hypothetical protein
MANLYYLFSRNKKIGSKIIAWASGLLVKDLAKVPSHMAILIEEEGLEPLVFESTLDTGVRIVPYENWLKINEECYKIKCCQSWKHQAVFEKVKAYWGKKYDWPGIAYFAWRFFLHLTLKRDFPKENAWQSENKYFCNELGGKFAGYDNYSMVTPAKMCSDFLKLIPQKDQQ